MRLQYRAHRQSTLRFIIMKYPDNQLLYHCSAVEAAPGEGVFHTPAPKGPRHCKAGPTARFVAKRESRLPGSERRSAREASPVSSCSTLRLPPESTREHERAMPALSEEKCRGSAASAALAIEHVLFPFVQHAECVADLRQGNVDGPRKLVVLIFRWIAHIDPLGSIGDLVACLLCREAVQQRLPEERGKVLPGQPQERSVRLHRNGGVSPGFRHQRFLAERIATFQLGEQHRDSSDHPFDLAAAGFDHEVEVPFSALANHRVSLFDVNALETGDAVIREGAE